MKVKPRAREVLMEPKKFIQEPTLMYSNGFHWRNLVSAISHKTTTKDIRCLI